MFLEEYGLPELNEELCVEAIKNKEDYVNNLKNGLLAKDPEIDDQKESIDNDYLADDKPNIYDVNKMKDTARYSQGSNETAQNRKSINTNIQTMSPMNRVRPTRSNQVGDIDKTEQGPMSIVIQGEESVSFQKEGQSLK